MDVGELVASLRLNLAEFKGGFDQARAEVRTGMNKVASEVESSSGKASKAMKDMATNSTSAANDMAEGIRRGPTQSLTDLDEEAKRVTWNVRGYLKDTGRVVTGILIAQGFYKVLSAIEGSISALFSFNQQLQQSEIAFEKMLGSAKAAKGFMKDLQDLSATTPFSYASAQKAAQNLLNVGWAADKVIPTLRTVIDAASLRGASPDVIDGIVLALGQIANKGKVSAEELNQLADRGIPAYQILRKELHLTAAQMQNMGKAGISSQIAIDALLRGIDKYAGGTSEKVARTTGGLVSSIKDNLLIVGNTAFASMFEGIRGGLDGIDKSITKLRTAARAGGAGGIFEAIFPASVRGEIRSIIGAVRTITSAIGDIGKAVWPIAQVIGGVFVGALATVLPILAFVVRGIADLAKWALQCTPVVRGVALAIIALTVASFASKAIMGLTIALRAFLFLTTVPAIIRGVGTAIRFMMLAFTTNPIVAVITAISIALIGLAMSSKTVSNWLDNVGNKIAALTGMDTSKILQPKPDEDGSLETYVNQLKDTKNAYGDMGEAATGAAKDAAKANKDFIASFDEVFNMKDDQANGAMGAFPGPGGGAGGPGGPGGGAKVNTGTPGGSVTDALPKMPTFIMLPELRWPNTGGPTAVATAVEGSMNQIRAALALTEGQVVPSMGRIGLGAELMGEQVRTAVNTTQPVVTTQTGLINTALGSIVPILKQVRDDWNTTMTYLKTQISSAVVSIGGSITSLNAAINSILPNTQRLRTDWSITMSYLLSTIQATVPSISAQVVMLNASLNTILPVLLGVRTDWSTTMAHLMSTLQATVPLISAQVVTLNAVLNTLLPVLLGVRTNWSTTMTHLLSTLTLTVPNLSIQWNILKASLNSLLPVLSGIRTAWSTTAVHMLTELLTYVPGLVVVWGVLKSSLASLNPAMQLISLNFHVMLESLKKDLNVFLPGIIATLLTLANPLSSIRTAISETQSAWSNAMASMQGSITSAVGPILSALQAVQKLYAEVMQMIGKAVSIPSISLPAIKLPDLSGVGSSLTSWWDKMKTALNPGTSITDPNRGGAWQAVDKGAGSLKGVSDFLSGILVPGAGLGGVAGGLEGGAIKVGSKLQELIDSLKNLGAGNAIPGFAGGGIIRRDSIIRAGEKNNPEAIIPLSNSSAMQPFADAIVNSMGGSLSGSSSTQHITLNAGVLVADKAGLKELERILATFRQDEGTRGANA
jgi:tape measure domain-containing protein